jgi:putative membrane protein
MWNGGHMMNWGGRGFGLGGVIGLLFMIVFWGLLIVGLVFLIRALSRGGHADGHHADGHHAVVPGPQPVGPSVGPSPALLILDERYARGDVERAEYLQRRADLMGYALPPAEPPIVGPQ